jgi:hypothetical protein
LLLDGYGNSQGKKTGNQTEYGEQKESEQLALGHRR